MATARNDPDEEGSLTARRRRLRVAPEPATPTARPKGDDRAADSERRKRPRTPRKRATPIRSDLTVAPAGNATSTAPERHTGRPSGIQAKTPRGPALAVARGGKTLGVRPAQIVPADAERWAEACRALRVLYRDFLAGCGLDVLRDRRSHATPAQDARQRRAA